jgi:hypothetical protein
MLFLLSSGKYKSPCIPQAEANNIVSNSNVFTVYVKNSLIVNQELLILIVARRLLLQYSPSNETQNAH